MSTPQNPDGSSDGSPGPDPHGQNPNGQPPSAPDYGNGQNAGQQPPQYGSQPGGQQYGSQQPFGASGNQEQPYGSQPSQPYGSQPGQNQNPYGQNPPGQDPYGQGQYGANQYGQDQYGQDQYGQDQYGQGHYGQSQYEANQYGQNPYDANGYDPNQYGQQPAYAAADGSSDQFVPANPNAAYGQFPAGSGGNTSKNLWGILALIGGIAGVLTSGLLFGGLLGIAAVVFGFIALSAIKKGLASNKGMSITGLILGFAAVLFTIVALIIYMFLGVGFLSAVESAASSQSPTSDPVDPSQGAGGSDGGQAAPAQGNEVEIGDDVTATVQVQPGTASEYASGADSSDGDIAIVAMTVKNDSSSDIEMTLARMEATDGGGKEYDDVFDTDYKGSLAFTDPVPAGGETTYELAFGVPADELDAMHIKLTLPEDLGNGKDFEFSKQ